MTSYEALLPQTLDSTILSVLRSCQQKVYWEHILGLRPGAISPDLHAGSAFAKGLETLYRSVYSEGLPLDLALGKMTFAFEKAWGDTPDPVDPRNPKTKANTLAALESYCGQYRLPNDPIQPWTDGGRDPFEFSFAIPLDEPTTGLPFPLHPVSSDPFIYAGRFDLLGRLVDIPVIRDDKTTKAIDKNWTQKWSFRGQFLGYCWALQQMGIPCDTVVIRGVAIQKTQTVHAEAIKQFPQHLLEKWLQQTYSDVIRLCEAWESGYWEISMGDHCTAYGLCSFLDLCTAKTPSDWFDTFHVRRWNPLKKEE